MGLCKSYTDDRDKKLIFMHILFYEYNIYIYIEHYDNFEYLNKFKWWSSTISYVQSKLIKQGSSYRKMKKALML